VRAGTLTVSPVTAQSLEGVRPPHPHVDLNLRYRSSFSTRQAGMCPVRVRRLRSCREVSPKQPMRVCLRRPDLGPSKTQRPATTKRPAPAAHCVLPYRAAATDVPLTRKVTGFDTREASSSCKRLGLPQRSGRRSGRSGERVDENLSGVRCPAREIMWYRLQAFEPRTERFECRVLSVGGKVTNCGSRMRLWDL
jgi:hypothetical protein